MYTVQLIYTHATCQESYCTGNSGLCCACKMSFECYLTSLCVDSPKDSLSLKVIKPVFYRWFIFVSENLRLKQNHVQLDNLERKTVSGEKPYNCISLVTTTSSSTRGLGWGDVVCLQLQHCFIILPVNIFFLFTKSLCSSSCIPYLHEIK